MVSDLAMASLDLLELAPILSSHFQYNHRDVKKPAGHTKLVDHIRSHCCTPSQKSVWGECFDCMVVGLRHNDDVQGDDGVGRKYHFPLGCE